MGKNIQVYQGSTIYCSSTDMPAAHSHKGCTAYVIDQGNKKYVSDGKVWVEEGGGVTSTTTLPATGELAKIYQTPDGALYSWNGTSFDTIIENNLKKITQELIAKRPSKIDNTPHLLPPYVYAPSTEFRTGQSVLNAGKIYRCTIGGTTGAASAPTHTTANDVQDGSVWWCFVRYEFVPNGSEVTSISGISTNPASRGMTTLYRDSGSTYTKAGVLHTVTNASWYKTYGQSPVTGIGTPFVHSIGGYISFYTDAKQLSLVVDNASFANSSGLHVRVNGKPVCDGYILGGAAGAGDGNYVDLVFPDNSVKLITIINGNNYSFFRAAFMDPGARAWSIIPDYTRAMIIGDSFFDSSEGSIADSFSLASGLICMHTNSIGGTGLISGGGNYYPSRISNITAYQPNLLIVWGSVNDSGQGAALTAAVTNYIASVRAVVPKCTIIFTGISGQRSTSDTTDDNAIKSGITASGDLNTYFIEQSGDPSGIWVDSTANANGTGINILTDNLHPNRRGRFYYGVRLYASVISKLKQLTNM